MSNELLRAVAEAQTPPSRFVRALDDRSALDEIDRDETASLLYPALRDHPALPVAALHALRSAYERALMRREIALQTLGELRRGLCAGGRVAIMQGLAALEHLYPLPWARTMGDLDLYLPDGHVAAAQSFLRASGFDACGSYGGVWARSGVVIDLHVDFWGADRVSARNLITRGLSVDLMPSALLPGYLVPVPGCAAVHAAFHALKHGFARKRWLFDLLMYFRAGHLGAKGMLGETLVVPIALDWLAATGLINTPERIGASVPLSRVRRFLLDGVLRRGDRAGYGELALALACPTAAMSVRYLLGSLFPQRRVLRGMYGARTGISLYACRFFSLFRKAAA